MRSVLTVPLTNPAGDLSTCMGQSADAWLTAVRLLPPGAMYGAGQGIGSHLEHVHCRQQHVCR